MNITKLYTQLNEGKVSKDFFMKNVRMQFPQYISPVTSFNDAVKILTGKRLISEAHKLNTTQVIDRLNPYHFRKGVEQELAKIKDPNDQDYERVREKVAKKMQKNPLAYEDQVFANAKDVEKKDKPLETQHVKEGNKVDKNRQMKKAKGQPEAKANTKTSKKENRKGNPKGVKHMTYNAKKAKGISKVLPPTGKEKVMESVTKDDVIKHLKGFLMEFMVSPSPDHEFQIGKEVRLPEGEGIVVEVNGSTLTVELKDGSKKDVQINYARHHTENETQEPPHTQNEFPEEGIQEESEQNDYDELEEAIDLNDPVLMAMRAKQAQRPSQSISKNLDSGKNAKINKQIDNLQMQLAQVMRDMEQEAEPSGGPIASEYGDKLEDLENQIKMLRSKLSVKEEDEIDELLMINQDDQVTSSTTGAKRPKAVVATNPSSITQLKNLKYREVPNTNDVRNV